MNYERIRAGALKSNDAMKGHHRCGENMGQCCNTTSVPVSEADQHVIERAIRTGAIHEATIRRAKENAENPTRTQCPFLAENTVCTLYEARPLACIAAGVGGLPVFDREGVKSRIENYFQTGVDKGYPVALTQNSMCGPCHQDMVDRRVKFPLSGIVTTIRVHGYNASLGTKPISEMVRMIAS